MILKKFLLVGAAGLFALAGAEAGTLVDGNFTGWNLSSLGATAGESGSMTLEASGGNPGARLNASTLTFVGGGVVYDIAINANFSTSLALSGTFTLGLQILSGPGDFGAGQGIGLVVRQGSDLYLQNLGTTGSGHSSWFDLTYMGSFTSASFSHLSGSGAAAPDFTGGVPTFFGFAAINGSNNQSVTEYYDNFSLTNVAVPEPSAAFLVLGASGLLVVSRFLRWRDRA